MATQVVSLNDASPNGVARLLHTVLAEKLNESPWKADTVGRLNQRMVRLELTDRGEGATVGLGSDGVGVRSGTEGKAHITIKLDMKALPLVLGVPLGPKRVPALWRGGGKVLLKALVGRRVRVQGLFTHPLLVVRVLQILGVPSQGGRR